jgi:hypothetical protein
LICTPENYIIDGSRIHVRIPAHDLFYHQCPEVVSADRGERSAEVSDRRSYGVDNVCFFHSALRDKKIGVELLSITLRVMVNSGIVEP